MELTVREQIAASVSGAGITALTMTPFDVVKVRSQIRPKEVKMLPYCNGLMDHIICSREAHTAGNKCRLHSRLRPSVIMGKRPVSCIDAKRCISIECCHNYTTKLALNAQQTKPWWSRCPVSEANTFRAMSQLAKTEGVATLWSGLPATIIMALPSTVLYFTAYEQLKIVYRQLSNSTGQPASNAALISSFGAGCTARLISTTCIAPLELIRTRMQVDGSSLKTVTTQLSKNLRVNGLRALYLGYGATILRDVPFSGVYFCSFEAAKLVLSKEDLNPNMLNCLSAMSAAMVAGLLTNPFDVIKTRQQMMLGTDLSRPTGLRLTYLKTVSTDGYGALMAGLAPRMLKVVPACAIMMTSYEASKRYFLEQRNKII